jgi:hypothetical protein
MIPADILNSLKTLALSQKSLVTATAPANISSNFAPGQQFQARVHEQLAPGIFKVQVADFALQLQLPNTIHTGDTITLQVASLLPRLTFNMTASTNPLSNSEQVSATARLLSSLTQQPLERNYVRSISSAPLWAGETHLPDTAELATKLHVALSQSGLFYEAHQAQWLAGSRNTAQLLQEPQNLPAQKVDAALNPNAAHAQVAKDSAPLASPANTQERISIPGIPDHLQSLVHQQLNALESRQVQWQGLVWPHQMMHWKINEDASHSDYDETGRQWSTQIQLDLPNMGMVTATLRFANSGLLVTLDANNSDTRSKLGAESSKLVAALTERGIKITSALVTQHDHA